MSMFEEFKRLGSSLVSDVLDEAGYHDQTLDPAIASIGAPARFCGPAVCVQGQRQVNTVNRPGAAATMPLYELPLIASGQSVLVLAANGFRGGAVTGGLLAAELKAAGCAGVVTDGFVRDAEELAETGLPVRAAGVIPLNGARRFRLVAWGAPVTMPAPEGGAVTVHPGDLVLGDGDGVVIIPQHTAPRILAMGRELERREAALRENAAQLCAAERAAARAGRMSHVEWLRGQEEVTS